MDVWDYALLTKPDGRLMLVFRHSLEKDGWQGRATIDTDARTLTLIHASGTRVRFRDFRDTPRTVPPSFLLAEFPAHEYASESPVFHEVFQ